jgi:phage head maturation protease
MNYDDKSLEKMSREELIDIAKYLRDRIPEGYSYLIAEYQSKIKSAKTGEFVSFAEFIETGNFRESLLEYVKGKLVL